MATAAYRTRLSSLMQEAVFKLKRSQEYLTSASILLADCKRRIEAGDPEAQGLTWSEYCQVHSPAYSPAHLDKLVRTHVFPDHGLADDEGSVGSKDAFDRAWSAFITLATARQKEFLRCGVAYTLQPERAPRDSTFGRQAGALDWQA